MITITRTEEEVKSFANKIELVQHVTTKHAIINYLLTKGVISTDGFIYKEIMSMDSDGCIKKQY